MDAIQACGGQKTADGRRFRNGGGVLWSIIKDREANAYKEIIKKATECEKQFRQPSVKQPPVQKKKDSSQGEASTFASGKQGNVSDNPFASLQMQDQHEPSGSEEKRNSVHDRIRIPVSYDDDLLGLSVKAQPDPGWKRDLHPVTVFFFFSLHDNWQYIDATLSHSPLFTFLHYNPLSSVFSFGSFTLVFWYVKQVRRWDSIFSIWNLLGWNLSFVLKGEDERILIHLKL